MDSMKSLLVAINVWGIILSALLVANVIAHYVNGEATRTEIRENPVHTMLRQSYDVEIGSGGQITIREVCDE